MKDVFCPVPLLHLLIDLLGNFTNATNILKKGSARLAAAIDSKKFDDIGTAEVLVTATNA
jgi:hypothetical protein